MSVTAAKVRRGQTRTGVRLLLANRTGLLGAALTAVFIVVGTVGATILLVPGLHHLWNTQDLTQALRPPQGSHPFGTDELGRDVMWRTIAGTGVSLLLGLEVTTLILGVGLTAGCLAGYFGGVVDLLIVGLIDLVWGFPLLLVAVLVAGMIGEGAKAIALALGMVLWAGFARVVRAEVKSLRELGFTEAAQALGVSSRAIILRHMLPNVMGTVLTMAPYYVAVTVIGEASFSYIGLGVQPPTPSLGSIIAEGQAYWSISVWPTVAPGIMICVIVLGLNLLGDGLRDVFDPQLRRA